MYHIIRIYPNHIETNPHKYDDPERAARVLHLLLETIIPDCEMTIALEIE